MKKQTGIWIDTKQAVIVELLDKDHKVQIIESGVIGQIRVPGETKEYTRMGSQYFTAEKKKDSRKEMETMAYIKSVAETIKGSDELLLMGPAGMKIVLEKYLRNEMTDAPEIADVLPQDKLTENQIVASVKDYFNKKVN